MTTSCDKCTLNMHSAIKGTSCSRTADRADCVQLGGEKYNMRHNALDCAVTDCLISNSSNVSHA
jgi:hypothetical protein